MTERRTFSESDLHAYLDSELSRTECDEFEVFVKTYPELGARIQAYRDVDEKLREALSPIAFEGVPAHLLETFMARHERSRSHLGWAAAVAILAFVLGGSIGWVGSGLAPGTSTDAKDNVQFAQNAHQIFVSEVRHPVEVAAADYNHLLGWLSKRLGHTLAAPNFSKQKFELIGGRLLPGAGAAAAAQFMYEDKSGQRITIYVAKNPVGTNTAFRLSESDDLKTFYWLDGSLGYALSGNIDEKTLLDLANAAYDQLSPENKRSESR